MAGGRKTVNTRNKLLKPPSDEGGGKTEGFGGGRENTISPPVLANARTAPSSEGAFSCSA